MRPWIGVDLDGTLAYYNPGSHRIGEPILPMVERIHKWLDRGMTVKIVTARASVPEHIPAVVDWLQEHNLPALEVTNQKDYFMLELWDDRAVQVIPNTGQPIDKTKL